MKATPFEFRFRFYIHVILIGLGFWAPWNMALHLDVGMDAHVWGALARVLGHGSATAFNVVLIVAILAAVKCAALRIWGAAYLGDGVVQSTRMYGASVVADGPYRYLRNPLYLGTFAGVVAMGLLMPPSGAVFAIVTVGLFQLRLIFAEEAFLGQKLGASYAAYCARVPRIVPSLRPRVAASGAKPHWGLAVAGEIAWVGVAVSFATLGWRYDTSLLTRCVIVSLGVSIIVRAMLPRTAKTAA